MKIGPNAARNLFVAGTIIVAAHTSLLLVAPNATLTSNVFILVMPLLGVAVCLLGAYSEPPETRPLWLLLGVGFLLGAVGQLGSMHWVYVTHLRTQTEAISSDFFFFAYGIPIMLAICVRGQDSGLKTFAWLDGAQALIAAILTYVQLFAVAPSFARPTAISAVSLMYLNNAENWILIGAVSLRFFSNPSPARKRFYRCLGLYLWIYGVLALIIGYLELERGWPDGLQDAAWGIPYLPLLGSFAFRSKTDTENTEQSGRQRTAGLLIDNLSPILFTLVITLMGVEIASHHPWLGFACIAAAVTIYGVRTAILQVRYARSQEELTAAMVATEQASRAKSQFLANMSHEIRTPMNGILGMTELALTTPLNEEQRDFLLTVKSSGDRLLAIINEILDYSKTEAGKTVLDSLPFHLPSVIGEALRSLAFLAHQKGLELTVQIEPNVPAELTGDPGRLGQVLINLVGNAIKFSERGEVRVVVSVDPVTNDPSWLEFSVSDTGIGIDPDDQDGLFQAFQQAHSSGSRLYGGTGLGLAVSKSLVALMGGTIGLRSAPGKGTTVTFTAHFIVPPTSHPAPLLPNTAAEQTLTTAANISASPFSLRILLAEDNAVNQRVAMTMLGKMGHRVTLAMNGQEALEEWRKGDFDLILMDVQMPEINGIQAAMQIRREEGSGTRTPIVAMTASAMSEDRDRCLAGGMDDFISKPVSYKVIEQMISAIFSHRK